MALSGSDRLFLVGCLVLVAVIRLGLTALSYKRIRGWLPQSPKQGSASAAELARVAWGVRNAARFVPRATCLTQALSGQIILARKGKASQVRIGVARDENGRFLAHAWLVSQERIVLGGAEESVRRFTPLVDFDWKRQ